MHAHFWLGLFTFANTLLVALLAMNVSRVRIRERVANGDGGNLALKKAIRAHGNGVEHLVVVGLQALVLDIAQAPGWVQGTLVVVYTLSRLCHAAAMLGAGFGLRRVAAAGTYASALGGAAAVLVVCVLG